MLPNIVFALSIVSRYCNNSNFIYIVTIIERSQHKFTKRYYSALKVVLKVQKDGHF